MGHLPGFHESGAGCHLPPVPGLRLSPQNSTEAAAPQAPCDSPEAHALPAELPSQSARPAGLELRPTGPRMTHLRKRRFDINWAQTRFYDDVDRQVDNWIGQRALLEEAMTRRLETNRLVNEHQRAIVERVPPVHLQHAFAAALKPATARPPLHSPVAVKDRLVLSVAPSYRRQAPPSPTEKELGTSKENGKARGRTAAAMAKTVASRPVKTVEFSAETASPYAQRSQAIVRSLLQSFLGAVCLRPRCEQPVT